MNHNLLFDKVLYLFNRCGAAQFFAGMHDVLRDALNLHRRHANRLVHCIIGTADGRDDFCDVKIVFSTVALDDFHICKFLSDVLFLYAYHYNTPKASLSISCVDKSF